MKIERAVAALDQQLREFRAMLDAVAPPVRPRHITTSEEAHAVGKFLLATARGEEGAFARECLLPWALVQDVAHRLEGNGRTNECRARHDARVAVPRAGDAAA